MKLPLVLINAYPFGFWFADWLCIQKRKWQAKICEKEKRWQVNLNLIWLRCLSLSNMETIGIIRIKKYLSKNATKDCFKSQIIECNRATRLIQKK